MFVVPGQAARQNEREEYGRPRSRSSVNGGGVRERELPDAERSTACPPLQGRRLPTITTLIPSTGRVSVATPKGIVACILPCAKGQFAWPARQPLRPRHLRAPRPRTPTRSRTIHRPDP